MYKLFAGVVTLALLCAIGYYQFNPEPLNARDTIEVGLKQVKEKTNLSPEQEMLLKVQLAISDYMAKNGTAPESLADLVPHYFDQEPKNPVTGESFPYRKEGKMPKLGAQVTHVAGTAKGKGDKKGESQEIVSADEGFVNPNTMVPEDFVYDKTGKRDPFEPLDLATKVEVVEGNSLTTLTLGQLRLTAVITAPSGEKKGIVEDATGRGYTVSVGTKMGLEGGEVVAIEPDRLKVIVTKVDFTGKSVQSVIEIKINQAGPSGQKKGLKDDKKKKQPS